MSKKVALIVTAEVATRIVVEVENDFDVKNLNEFQFENIAEDTKERLAKNLYNDICDCITDIDLDRECPYKEFEDVAR